MDRNGFFRRFRDVGTGRLPAGSQLDKQRYLVTTTIGKGGMGAVYLAIDTRMRSQNVAIKEMSQAHLADPGALRRARQSFQQEADMLRQLRHPNLPAVYTSFEENDRSYLVMEYIEGRTLGRMLKQAWNRLLPVSQVIEYGLQISNALTYLHTHSTPLIYLDLKPPNIMVRKDGRVLLIDFGIAHFYHPGLTIPTDEIFCTLGYAPPEQMVGQPEPRSDLFALGATLHQCLSGQSPQGHTREHLFDFPPLQPLNPQMPEALDMLIQQLLRVDPHQRPASASLVHQRLQQIQRQVVPPLVLAGKAPVQLGVQDWTIDHNGTTIQNGSPSLPIRQPEQFPPSSPLDNDERVAQLFPQLVRRWRPGSLVPKQLKQHGVTRSLLTFVRAPWDQARAIVSNQKIWDPGFVALLLTTLLLSLGGGLAFLQMAPDPLHVRLLGWFLILAAVGVVGAHLSGKRLDDPVTRAILGLMGLSLLLAALAIQGLPDMEAAARPFVQHATLNQVCMLGLLALAVISLARPEKSLARVDQLLLGLLAIGAAFWQYGFGQSEFAQFSVPSTILQGLNNGLIGGLLLPGLLVLLLMGRPFRGWSRFWLLLVTAVFTAFQYTTGFHEFQAFHLKGSSPIILSFAFTWIPLCCALLALLTRCIWLTRVALFTLTLAEIGMMAYQGQEVFLPFLPANHALLSINILAFSTLSQILGPILLVILLLALVLLPGKGGFSWLDHGLLLAGAFFGAHLDEAFWQVQNGLFATNPNQAMVHQQYLVLAGLIPAYLIYWLLVAYPLVLSVMVACYFWRLAHPYARVEGLLRRAQAFLIVIDRVLVLALLTIALLLTSSMGTFAGLFQDITRQLFPAQEPDILLILTLLSFAVLAVMAVILIMRLLRRKEYALGRSERVALLCSALTCLLLLWQNPTLAALPLLNQPIQLTGNVFHWSPALLHFLLLPGLGLAPGLAFFWFRRSFFADYRALLNLLFLIVLLCALLQFIWPLFLVLGMLFLLPGIVLAVQVEKTA